MIHATVHQINYGRDDVFRKTLFLDFQTMLYSLKLFLHEFSMHLKLKDCLISTVNSLVMDTSKTDTLQRWTPSVSPCFFSHFTVTITLRIFVLWVKIEIRKNRK